MKRCLFNLLTGVSLVVCIAAMLLTAWPSFYFRSLEIPLGRHRIIQFAIFKKDLVLASLGTRHEFNEYIILDGRGDSGLKGIFPQHQVLREADEAVIDEAVYSKQGMRLGPPWATAYFCHFWREADDPDRFSFVGARTPAWMIALPFALVVCARIWVAINRRRIVGAGHCHRCGYDLRATPERCPECGAAANGNIEADETR